MKAKDVDILEVMKRIRFAVDNDPLAKDAYKWIAHRTQATSGITTSAKDASDFVSHRKPMTDAARAVIAEFAEKHGIRIR